MLSEDTSGRGLEGRVWQAAAASGGGRVLPYIIKDIAAPSRQFCLTRTKVDEKGVAEMVVSPEVVKFAFKLAEELVSEAVLLSSTQAWNIRCSGQCRREQCRQDYYQSLLVHETSSCIGGGRSSSSSAGSAACEGSTTTTNKLGASSSGPSPGLCWTPELPPDEGCSSPPQNFNQICKDNLFLNLSHNSKLKQERKQSFEYKKSTSTNTNIFTSGVSSDIEVCKLTIEKPNLCSIETECQSIALDSDSVKAKPRCLASSPHTVDCGGASPRGNKVTDLQLTRVTGSTCTTLDSEDSFFVPSKKRRGKSSGLSNLEMAFSIRESSAKKPRKRRIKTRKRSSCRNRNIKSSVHHLGLESCGSKLVSRRQRTDGGSDVYSLPVDNLADPGILHPKAVNPTRRKYRIANSTITAGLPFLNASSITHANKLITNITPNIAFNDENEDCVFTKTDDFKFVNKKNVAKDKKLAELSSPASRQSIVSTVGGNMSSSCVAASPTEVRLHSDGKQSVVSDPIFRSSPGEVIFQESDDTIQSEKANPSCSSYRVSRKDRHEHHRICRILPFTALKSCKRKDHSSESRDEVYMASPQQGSSKERSTSERKRGQSLFSNIRNSLLSLFSFGSNDRSESKDCKHVHKSSSAATCNSTSVDSDSHVLCNSDSDTPAPAIDAQQSNALLNHSNYSAFTSVINAVAPPPDACSDDLRPPTTNLLSSDHEALDKDTLLQNVVVLNANDKVAAVEPISADGDVVAAFVVPRSPVGVSSRALPPLPQTKVQSDVPPIPSPLPRAVLASVTHPLLSTLQEILPSQTRKDEGCHFASMIHKVKDVSSSYILYLKYMKLGL